MRPARRQRLLGKADSLFGPVRPIIHRSGEREPVAFRVEVVAGVTQIARALRSAADGPAPGVQAVARPRGALFNAQPDGGTITGNTLRASTIDGPSVAGTTTTGSRDGGMVRSQLTMVDRSDSGCRLHGAASAETPLLPGVLFAFRMDPASPWTLAVVRRVKKRLAGKRVEIGAEYLGSDPRRVVIVIPDPETAPPRPPGVEVPRFSAIFLPDSKWTPGMPFGSLILPSHALVQRDRLSLHSRSDHCTIRLGEPIEEQAGFIWSPFEILDRQLQKDPPKARNSAAPVVSQAR